MAADHALIASSMTALERHFREMARNNAWANHRLYGACAQLTAAELKAPRVGFFPSLHATLSHILIIDWYYLDALEAGGRGLSTLAADEPFDRFEELRAAQGASDRRLIAFCDALGPAELDRLAVIDRGAGVHHRETIQAILAHLFQHQIHHRGQAHAMLSGTRVPPPQLDEYFLANDAPLRAAELQALGLAVR